MRVSEVFKFSAIDHVRNHRRWDPDLQLEQIRDGPIGMRTLIRRTNIRCGTPVVEIMEITEFEKDEVFSVIVRDSSFGFRGRVTFTAKGPDNKILTSKVEFNSLDQATLDLINSCMERSYQNIKMMVESDSKNKFNNIKSLRKKKYWTIFPE